MQQFMKIIIILAALACMAILAVCLAGCTEKNLEQVDGIAGMVEDVGGGVLAVIDSPAGDYIPPPYGAIARLGGEAILGLAGLWSLNRTRVRGVVLRSVVQAIDKPGDVKDNVKSNLKAAGMEYEGRKIIGEYKKVS